MYKDDRRMFERFEVNSSVGLKYFGSEATSFAQCCDVSAAGAGLLSEEKLIPEINLEIRLATPGGQAPFRSKARVVWSKQVQENKWRAGLEFKKVDFMRLRKVFAAATNRK